MALMGLYQFERYITERWLGYPNRQTTAQNARAIWYGISLISRVLTFAGDHQNETDVAGIGCQHKIGQRVLGPIRGHSVKINAAFWFQLSSPQPLKVACVHGRGLRFGWRKRHCRDFGSFGCNRFFDFARLGRQREIF